MISENEYMATTIQARLEWYIERFEKPKWMNWFGCYPAMSSVEASKAQLKAMLDSGLVVTIKDTIDNASR